jgi:hypothetical protein
MKIFGKNYSWMWASKYRASISALAEGGANQEEVIDDGVGHFMVQHSFMKIFYI